MTNKDLAAAVDNLDELLAIPGQSVWLRNVVLDLAVSGRLLPELSSESAHAYLDRILDRNQRQKPAKKLVGITPAPLGAAVPRSWATTMLGNVSSDIRYGTSEKTEDSGEIPVLRMGNIQNQQLQLTNLKFLPETAELGALILEDGDLLFNRTNSAALVGKSAVFHGDGRYTYASYLIRVRLCPEVNADFVNLWLGSPVGRAWAARVRTDAIGQSNINGTSLGQFPLALPIPSEQAAIVARVQEIFALIEDFEVRNEDLEIRRRAATVSACHALAMRGDSLLLNDIAELVRTKADADDVERAVFGLAVSGRLSTQVEADGNGTSLVARFVAQNKQRRKVESSAIPAIAPPFALPVSWEWSTLGVAGSIVGGGTPRSGRSDCFTDDPRVGLPWFTPADLGGNSSMYVSIGRRSLTDIGLSSSSAQRLPAGAVLFSSRAPIGYVAILTEPAATNQGFKTFVPHDGLLSEFAYFWLRYWAPEIDATAPSVTFREVNAKSMLRQPIPVPPTAEQERIVATVRRLLAAIAELRSELAA